MVYRTRKPRRRYNKLIPATILGLIFVFIISSCQKTQIYNLQINDNQTLSSLAKELKNQNIIQSEKLFLFTASQNNLDKNIHTGSFKVNSKMSNKEILEILNQPSQSTIKVTIPEGFTIKQISERVKNPGLQECLNKTCGDKKLTSLVPEIQNKGMEGFLFPNTYNYNNLDELSIKMTKEFIKQLPKDYQTKLAKLPIKSLYEAIIVASMLEKEVITQKDKQLAAGIIYKRLSNNWTLGIDATLLYKKNNREITITDLQANDPYNTRKLKGLPPTPICNPGYESIYAALNPIQSPYWFYITEPINNRVIYGKNNAEHQANVQKYLR